MNARLIEQVAQPFPIHGFALVASRRDRSIGPQRWQYLGLLEYLRHYCSTQLDAKGSVRSVWMFEFRVHQPAPSLCLDADQIVSAEVILASRSERGDVAEDKIVQPEADGDTVQAIERIEGVRRRLLAMAPRQFEYLVRDLLVHSGFTQVCVTKYSADGGIDVNAQAGPKMWMFERTALQVQAKRWLHSVGRKEVAELRGSLQPLARGAVLTTGHFSKAAINEAGEAGKVPITLIDGYKLSRIVLDEQFDLSAWAANQHVCKVIHDLPRSSSTL